mmetsp:Transcript_29652/g.47212  ORF Transcript_29652/g.47212 Transcript_29652/m.47212 type:complete len:209 (+) Transcript_29652:1192-1818(+)
MHIHCIVSVLFVFPTIKVRILIEIIISHIVHIRRRRGRIIKATIWPILFYIVRRRHSLYLNIRPVLRLRNRFKIKVIVILFLLRDCFISMFPICLQAIHFILIWLAILQQIIVFIVIFGVILDDFFHHNVFLCRRILADNHIFMLVERGYKLTQRTQNLLFRIQILLRFLFIIYIFNPFELDSLRLFLGIVGIVSIAFTFLTDQDRFQ